MAKLEHKLEKGAVKKQKTKKRKHATADNTEEVASKILVLELTQNEANKAEPLAAASKPKAVKRKHKDEDIIQEKRSKHTADAAATDSAVDELHEPTLTELLASEKPENVNAVVTVRQKKKQKHLQRLEAQKDHTGEREKNRNEEYLHKWKHARGEWKFEKLRQISIQQSVFDEQKINASMWPIALEYLSGSKGAAKEKIIKIAEQCIDELDQQCTQQHSEEEKEIIVNSVKYQRARELLQRFD